MTFSSLDILTSNNSLEKSTFKIELSYLTLMILVLLGIIPLKPLGILFSFLPSIIKVSNNSLAFNSMFFSVTTTLVLASKSCLFNK